MAEIKEEKGGKYLDPLVGSRPPTLQENLLSGISGMGFRIPNLLPICVNATLMLPGEINISQLQGKIEFFSFENLITDT